jgi:molybdate transport system substrate-binding protein
MKRALALATLAVLVTATPASARGPERTLSVAAAANLKIAMQALKEGFEAERPGVEVAVTTGASGNFLAQIQNGAPFDVFFSADREYAQKLVAAGLGSGDGEVVYAIGTLVVWTPKGSAIALEEKGLAALTVPAVKRIAIANPAVAPYGRAAEAALRAANLLDLLKDRLVLGQNVSQAAQFAQSGAADAAFIPRSLTFSPELRDGRVYTVPASSYPALQQSAVVLRAARSPALAKAFVEFVTGTKGRAILTQYGYTLP